MTQIAGLLAGTNQNFDTQLTALEKALLSSSCVVRGVGGGLAVSATEVAIGEAFIRCTRTNGEEVMVHYKNSSAVSIAGTGTKKVYVVVDQAKLDDGSSNALDGSGIASIETGASYPSGNYLPLASIASDVITDARVFHDTLLTTLSTPLLQVESANIASATTTDLSTMTGDTGTITGTTTITGLGTVRAGALKYLTFSGILILTHHGTSLKLPNAGNNITTAAGDRMIARSLGSGNWEVLMYQRADGTALVASTPGVADETTPGLVERDTDAEALAFADITRFINAYQLGLATGACEQDVPYAAGAVMQNAFNMRMQTTLDGSVMVLVYPNAAATSLQIIRMARENNSNQYVVTHSVTLATNCDNPFCVIVGNYVYVGYSASGTKTMRRYDLADLTNITTITVSGAWTAGGSAFSDGTKIYIATASNQFLEYTISGTTITSGSTITYTSSGDPGTAGSACCDGTNVWIIGAVAVPSVIRKYALAGGAVVSTTNRHVFYNSYGTSGSHVSPIRLFIPKKGVLGMAFGKPTYSEAAQVGSSLKIQATIQP